MRSNDYTFTIEGELVRIDDPCDRDRRDPDGGCGCGRGFSGMSSARATTTAVVVDLPMTRAEYARAYFDSLVAAGYLRSEDHADPEVAELIHREVEVLLRAAAMCPVGTVVERRLDQLRSRPDRTERPMAS
jgi:hypothetical protein